MTAKAAITARLAVTRLFATVRIVFLPQSLRSAHPGRAGNAGRVKVTPPHVMRRSVQGTGSIEVTVRQSRGGDWADGAAKGELSAAGNILPSPGGVPPGEGEARRRR